jgi:hypothetical protein
MTTLVERFDNMSDFAFVLLVSLVNCLVGIGLGWVIVELDSLF